MQEGRQEQATKTKTQAYSKTWGRVRKLLWERWDQGRGKCGQSDLGDRGSQKAKKKQRIQGRGWERKLNQETSRDKRHTQRGRRKSVSFSIKSQKGGDQSKEHLKQQMGLSLLQGGCGGGAGGAGEQPWGVQDKDTMVGKREAKE